MGDFKNQFKEVFDQAPSFSKQARVNVKKKIRKRKTNRRWPGLIVIAVAVAFISAIIWNEQLFDNFNTKETASITYAPEHGDLKQEVIPDILINRNSQVVISNDNSFVSMDRGNGEYFGKFVVETNFDEVKYGQVVMVEEDIVDSVYTYDLARVIGKPGDKVKIEDGQIYLNDAPIAAFYGKAHSADFMSEEEENERKKLINQEINERIKKEIMISMDEVTVNNGELFIVSDNWTSQSVRKVINETDVEGIVLGYMHEREDEVDSRALTEEEFATIKALSEQVLASLEAKDLNALKSLTSYELTIDEKRGEIYESWLDRYNGSIEDSYMYRTKIEKQPVTNEIGESFFSYFQYRSFSNEINLDKGASIGYKYKDKDGYQFLSFKLENGEWKFKGFMY